MKNVAILMAGGHGARMGAPIPKQFLMLKGKTIIEHTVDAFQQNERIDEIAVVMHHDFLDRMRGLSAINGWSKLKKILPGGSERYMSSLAAIEAYQDYPADTRMLFHDAVRPLVSQRIINEVIDALENSSAVGVGLPTTDTIWELDEKLKNVNSIPDRKYLYRAQTPQAFTLGLITEAYSIGLQTRPFVCTDDCGVVAKYKPQVPIRVVMGESANLKITIPEDIAIAEQVMSMKEE